MKICFWLFAIMLGVAAHASAQYDAALVLARVCVHEAGFDADRTGDCDGIFAVLRRVGRGDIIRGASRYSRRLMSGVTPRPWVLEMDLLGSRPDHWPSSLEWDPYKKRWLKILFHAQDLLRGVKTKCSPDHWGMRSGIDLARAIRAGWNQVTCGTSKNAFWRM